MEQKSVNDLHGSPKESPIFPALHPPGPPANSDPHPGQSAAFDAALMVTECRVQRIRGGQRPDPLRSGSGSFRTRRLHPSHSQLIAVSLGIR